MAEPAVVTSEQTTAQLQKKVYELEVELSKERNNNCELRNANALMSTELKEKSELIQQFVRGESF